MHDIARAAADAARVPDFADVLARGQRRSKVRNGVVAGVAAVAVAAIIGGAQLIGPGESSAPQPAPPSPPTTVKDDEPSNRSALDLFIDDPDAFVGDAAVTENGATAVLWQVADRKQSGLAVSADGYDTRHLARLPIPGDVFTAGDRFLVRDEAMSKVWVAGPAGGWTEVEVAGPEAPVADGEVPVSMSDGLVAVNPGTARAHPVDAPEGTWRIDSYGGRLTAITTVNDSDTGQQGMTYHWSDDGGASWQSATFTLAFMWSEHVVPTAAGTDHAIAISSDGGIAPLAAVLTMPADGGGFTETPYDGELATIAGAWTVDGEIRFLGDLWSNDAPRESGVYRWIDGRLELIPSSAPDVTDADDSTLLDVVDTDDGPSVLIAVDDRLFESTDGGATWTSVPAR